MADMHEDPASPNLVANRRLRTQFLARFMAAHTKNHKVTRSKARRVHRHRARAPKVHAAKTIAVPRPVMPLIPKKVPLAKDEEEPKPEDLAKEEPVKPEEVEQVTAISEPEGPALPRG